LDIKLSEYRFAPIRMLEPEKHYLDTLKFDPAKIRQALEDGRQAVERMACNRAATDLGWGMPDTDLFQLQRFVDAHERSFEIALAELHGGKKQSHWMWYIFPQLAGLGRSPNAQFYGMRSLQEARAYLAHPVLGQHYRDAVQALLGWAGRRSAGEILGSIDAMKLRSSLTLFENASGDPLLADAIEAFFDGPDDATLSLLKRS
jgi:uncharacterized protein (DUF1810 family)